MFTSAKKEKNGFIGGPDRLSFEWFEAISEGDVEKLRALLKKGVAITLKNTQGRSILHLAAQHNDTELARFAIYQGALITDRDLRDFTPLHLAATYNAFEVAELLLLSRGVDINCVTDRGHTPLMMAAWFGYSEVFSLLLRWGADDELLSKDGFAAIHYAAWAGHTDILDLLEAASRRLFIRTSQRLDITDIAKIRSHQSIIERHQKNMRDTNSFQSIGYNLVSQQGLEMPLLSELSAESLSSTRDLLSKKNETEDSLHRVIDLETEEEPQENEPFEGHVSPGGSLVGEALHFTGEKAMHLNDKDFALEGLEEESTREMRLADRESPSASKTPSWMNTSGLKPYSHASISQGSSVNPANLPTDEYAISASHGAGETPSRRDPSSEYEIPFTPSSFKDSSLTSKFRELSISKGKNQGGLGLELPLSHAITQEPFDPKPPLIYRSISGQYCSTPAEMFISSFFYLMNIEFKYRRSMSGTVIPGTQTPTFTIFDRNGNVIIWLLLPYNPYNAEHSEKWNTLKLWYQTNGFTFDVNFLMSHYDDESRGVDGIDLYNKVYFIKQQL